MRLKDRAIELWHWFHQEWNYASIVNAHRAAGSANPIADANQEVFLRGNYLEAFRDYASDRYLAGHDLESSAAEFIKRRLAAKTTALDASTTASVRAVIRDMKEDEAFHPPVYRKYRTDFERQLAAIRAESKRIYGPTGMPPLVTRVLRGNG